MFGMTKWKAKMTDPIEITATAAAQIAERMFKAPQGTIGLRLTVKPTGCSGNSYEMEYVKDGDDLSADDKFTSSGAELYIPKMHSWMLFGMIVDYAVDELGNSGFVFVNPNETGRCGCGESFTVERP